MQKTFVVHHLEASTEGRLTDVLGRQIQMTPERTNELLYQGSVWIDQVRVREDIMLNVGQYLRIHAEPRRFPTHKIDWQRTILFDDPDFLVIQKPAGIPVHPTVDNWVENVLFCLKTHLGYPVYITQRLDTPTEGVLVVAKTKWFQGQFNKLLRERSLTKNYKALVPTRLPLGEVVHYMKNTMNAPKEVSTENFEDSIECRLILLACKPVNDGFEVDIQLLTGRTHQIRAQLAALGSPILGDAMYGSTHLNPWMPRHYEAPESIALRAHSVEFQHPSSQKILRFEHKELSF